MIDSVDNEKIFNLLLKEGFSQTQVSLSDEFYAIPTTKDIAAFANRYLKFLWSSGLNEFTEEVWDCDDFAFTAKGLASIDNALWKKKTGNLDASIAFGIAWIVEKSGGHAVNMAILRQNGELVVKYFEPQIQKQEYNEYVCLKEIPRKSFSRLSWCYL